MYKFLKLDYARNSFRFLIKEFGIKEIRLPYYLCDVMRHGAFAEGCKILFYHIDDNFMPAESFNEKEFILYPNYFGICEKNVKQLSKIYPNLIVDNAHSLYSEPMGIACFNSVRKFIPKRTESFLFIKENSPEPHAESFDELERISKKRTISFKKLNLLYHNLNLLKFDLKYITSPFCYPCLTATENEADLLVKKLEQEGKIIYRYWNTLPKTFNEYKFYSRLVPIPLDN